MKKQMKKIVGMLMMCMMLSFLVACGSNVATSKVITEDNLQITLTDQFEKQDASNMDYKWFYMSDEMAVMCAVEQQSELDAAGLKVDSAHTYGEACAAASEYVKGEIQDRGSYAFCEYTAFIDGNDFSYIGAFYKNGDTYYAVTVSCLTQDVDTLKSQMQGFLDSVTFN